VCFVWGFLGFGGVFGVAGAFVVWWGGGGWEVGWGGRGGGGVVWG